MGLFKKGFSEKVFFAEKKDCKFKVLLSLESKDNNVIISYLDGKSKRKRQITEKSLNDYLFVEKTKNLFYKKFKEINPSSLLKEMDTGGAGIGGTATDMGAPTSDTYATGDARLPKVIGGMTRRGKITDGINTPKEKKKKKKKKRPTKYGKGK